MIGPGPARHPSLRTCTFCQTRLDVHQAIRGICANPVCRGKYLQDLARQRQAKQEEVGRAALAFRAQVAESLGVTDAESITLAVVPHFDRPVVKLPLLRRQQARRNLSRIVRDAVEPAQATEPQGNDEPASAAAHERASCETCRGHCCGGGGTHAYLDATAMRGYLARHPGQSVADVLRAFVRAIPDASYENSCVYHGRHGCALPREMRSPTCNRYRCAGLIELGIALATRGARPVLIVSAGSSVIERSTLIPAEGAAMNPPRARPR